MEKTQQLAFDFHCTSLALLISTLAQVVALRQFQTLFTGLVWLATLTNSICLFQVVAMYNCIPNADNYISSSSSPFCVYNL